MSIVDNGGASELGAALSDVRSAYRLVHAYQRRVYDIIEEFVSAFEDRKYYWWCPVDYDKPGSANPLDRMALNMLPMVRTSFLYLGIGTDYNFTKPGEWMLELFLESDTGFELNGRVDPEVRDFDQADKCMTTLRALAWCPTKATKLNWLHGLWRQVEWPTTDKKIVETNKPPVRVVAQTFDLSMLADKAAVRNAAAEFKTLVESCRRS